MRKQRVTPSSASAPRNNGETAPTPSEGKGRAGGRVPEETSSRWGGRPEWGGGCAEHGNNVRREKEQHFYAAAPPTLQKPHVMGAERGETKAAIKAITSTLYVQIYSTAGES